MNIIDLNNIENNSSIKFCYIRKYGSYYRPNSSGYTDHIYKAGIYSKEEAIEHAKSCDELSIIPINIDKHNQIINDEINDLKSRLL